MKNQCRQCLKVYEVAKSTSDFRAYCSKRCQHLMARSLGWHPGGPSEYMVLKKNEAISSIPAEEK